MKLISWNVNGLRACMTKGFNDFLAAEDPDVICLQETKMQREQADFDFAGYTEFWNSAEKKGYAGTAIFTKTEPLNMTYLRFQFRIKCVQCILRREKAVSASIDILIPVIIMADIYL